MKKPNSTYRSKRDRRKVAEEIMAERAKRSHQEQLNELDRRLGKNIGAKKERNKLAERLNSSQLPSAKSEGLG